jgi:phage baseplate assembly protein W
MSALPLTRAPDVVTLTILIDGTELPRSVPVLGVDVVSQANRIPYARLRIGDGDAARGKFDRSAGDLFVPGNTLVLRAGYHGETKPVFTGIVLSQRLVVRRGTSWLEVDCRDPSFRMTLVRRNRYFADKADSDVASELLDAYKADKVSAGDIAATSVVHPQLLQYQATDWDFMVSRLEAAGQVVFVDAGKVSSVKPSLASKPVADLGFGATVLELDAEMDARSQTGGVRVLRPSFGWKRDALMFEPLSTSFASYLANEIETAILFFESRIALNSVNFDAAPGQEGLVLIKLDYTVRTTNTRTNLVYPFYVQQATNA